MNDRLTLRALEPADTDAIYKAEADEAAWRYSDYLAPLSHHQLKEYALNYEADPFRSGQLRLVIDYEGEIAGILDIFEISPRHLRGDIGIYLLPAFRGKDLGLRTLRLAERYCSERLGLNQLNATISSASMGARECFEKAGFVKTGTRPEWLRTHDGFEDADIFWCKL